MIDGCRHFLLQTNDSKSCYCCCWMPQFLLVVACELSAQDWTVRLIKRELRGKGQHVRGLPATFLTMNIIEYKQKMSRLLATPVSRTHVPWAAIVWAQIHPYAILPECPRRLHPRRRHGPSPDQVTEKNNSRVIEFVGHRLNDVR